MQKLNRTTTNIINTISWTISQSARDSCRLKQNGGKQNLQTAWPNSRYLLAQID